MSKRKSTPTEKFPEGQAASTWLAILAQPASAAGVIPDGHEGFYQPSADELREGFRVNLTLNSRMAEEQTKLAETELHNFFPKKRGK